MAARAGTTARVSRSSWYGCGYVREMGAVRVSDGAGAGEVLHAGIVAGPVGSWDDWAASRILAAQDRIGVADFLGVRLASIPAFCVRSRRQARDRKTYLALPLPISGIIALY